VRSADPPIYFDRRQTDDVWDQVAQYVASLIEDENCLAFSIIPLYEALARRPANKGNLGIHSPFFGIRLACDEPFGREPFGREPFGRELRVERLSRVGLPFFR